MKKRDWTIEEVQLFTFMHRGEGMATQDQSDAWVTVYKFCMENGMKRLAKHSGIESVLLFIGKGKK